MKKELEIKLKEELTCLSKRLKLKNISEAFYFPKYFEIETIRACNAKCRMCTINEWNNKNNKMNDEFFYKFVKEISNYNNWIETVCLSRNGEPLLDKNLEKKIKLLKNYGISNVSFSTNVSLLNEKRAVSIINSGLDDIRFSVDGFTRETFEYIRNGLKFEQIKENILRFIEFRNKNGKKPKIHIRMVRQKANYHEENDWKEFWMSKVSEQDIVSSKPMANWGNQLENYEENCDELTKYSFVPCISPWSTMVIHFDGKIPLCGCDYNNKILIGDLNNSTIKEIWNSEKFNKIRSLHTSGKRNDISLCRGCNIWDLDIKKKYKNE